MFFTVDQLDWGCLANFAVFPVRKKFMAGRKRDCIKWIEVYRLNIISVVLMFFCRSLKCVAFYLFFLCLLKVGLFLCLLPLIMYILNGLVFLHVVLNIFTCNLLCNLLFLVQGWLICLETWHVIQLSPLSRTMGIIGLCKMLNAKGLLYA